MLQASTCAFLLFGWALIEAPGIALAQDMAAGKTRELKLSGGDGQPSFSVQIRAQGRNGLITVREENGREVERLACPLLRDNGEATQDELAAVREQFVAHFMIADLDSDGHADLAGIREFGAKWSRYCVWLYDPRQHLFVKDFLAEQMELLTNLTALREGRVSSSQIGPAHGWTIVYRVTAADEGWPARQLIPVRSCRIESNADGGKPAAVVITRLEDGKTAVQRQDLAQPDMRAALDACSPKP
jgi:hypothetical protein